MIRKKQFWLCLLLFLIIGSYGWAQSNVSIDQNTITIRSALNEIENQTGYSIGYDEKVIDVNKKISIKTFNKSVETVLDEILKNTNYTYTIKNKHILIVADKKSLAQPKSVTISGKIVDVGGEPLIGVSVVLDGTSIGSVTDFEGMFNLSIPDHKGLLVTSYLGYVSRRIALTKDTNYNIVLEENSKALDEVVVIGYNTIRKKDLTTSVAIVTTEDISERPLVSAGQAIQGRAAGVQVIQPSGQPGSALSIRVRGATSIEAGNEPLYVVDGLPMTNIGNLSPNDIESLQVLKDASSAAIYGARAANGVVLITTKRGKVGSRSVTFNAYTGFSRLGKKIDALNTEQYKSYIKDYNRFAQTPISVPDSEIRYIDWSEEFFGTGVNQSYQVSLSNGAEKTQYFVSAGYLDEKGIVSKSNFKRYNFRTNIDSEQTSWLKIGVNVAYTNTSGREVYENRSSMRAGSILSVINTPPYMQTWDPNNSHQYDENAYGARILNPFAANAADQTYNKSRINGSANLLFTLSKHLNYKMHFGIDETNSKSLFYLDPISNSDGRSTKGYVKEGFARDFDWLFENLVTYTNTFNKKHNVSVLGGATMQKSQSTESQIAGYDMLEAMRSINGANIIDVNDTWVEAGEWRLGSYLARVAYDYESKYLLTTNVRADGSSKFSTGHKWGIFPSLSAGWRISSEPFMAKTSDVISDLKLRAGWGVNGNQEGIGNYMRLAQNKLTRVPPSDKNLLPGFAISPNTPGNLELTWETTTQYNLGVDLSMLNSRVTVTLDAYYKHTRDMLKTVTLPDNMNYPGGVTRNDGEMKNKGFEAAVSSVNMDGRFKWSTDFNIAFNKNEVTKLGVRPVYYYGETYETKQPTVILREGLSLGTFWGYVSKGVDPETGNIIYQDLDDNGIITPDDRTVIGDAQPLFIFGLTNNFSFKNFNLSVFFQGSYGNDIFNVSRIDMTSMTDFRNQSTDVLRRWKRPGMETDIPSPGNMENNYNSSRFIEDGSYIRLKNISLSYNFSSTSGFLKKMGIHKLQPYITGQNLWTLTNYTGYDPEVSAYASGDQSAVALGVDYGTYPQSKIVIFGLNVEF